MRKPFALLLFGFVATTSQGESTPGIQSTPPGLPKDVVPRSYLIHLEPDIERRVLDGVESIEIEVLKPTTQIVLNAVDTEIAKARIEIDNQPEQLSPNFDRNGQTVSFHLTHILPVGKYTLSLQFQNRIVEEPHGLFIRRYEVGPVGAVEHLLLAGPQTAETRRIFPCWDEPEFRANFQLSIKTGSQNTVFSKMPIVVEQSLGPDEKITVFENTPLISSDMLFLVCGKLEWLQGEVAGVTLRIVTPPGKREWATYAMEVTKQLLPYFASYFAIPFPMAELDQIAFPSDADDGPGNYGEIVSNEDVLLCDPETNYEHTRQRIFLAIADNIVRHWYGELVPATSPDDLWVREGLASWISKKAADHFQPNWKIWLQAATQKEATMDFDAGEMAHPLQSPVAGNATDMITRQKPWLLLRMIEDFSGEGPFRDGVRAYLSTRQANNGANEDLWESLENATRKPIKKIVAGWAEQAGFPLIKITAQCLNGHRIISLEQVPFVLAKRDETPALWNVPVGIRSAVTSNEVKYALLDKLSNNFDLAGCSGVIQANAGNAGYFRVLYEPALFNDLQKNVEKLPEGDRLNLVTDTWALVEAGNLPVSSLFDLLENLRGDESFALWQNVLGTGETVGALRLIDRLEQGGAGREAYQKYICSLFTAKLQELGWDEKPGESNETQSYRATLIEALGFFGDRGVIDESFRRFENYRENPSTLSPNLRSAVITIVGRYSSQTVNRELLRMADDTKSVEEKRMYLRALGAALDPQSAQETLQYLGSDKMEAGDLALLLECFGAEGEHPDIAWSFAAAHLPEMQNRLGLLDQSRLFSSIATGFTDNDQADEILAFAQANLPPATFREVEYSSNEIRFRARLKARTLPAIDAWIKVKLEAKRNGASHNP
jgi:aminopeptidase N